MNNNAPKEIDDDIIDFCKTIVPYSIPEYVLLRPEMQYIENECYDNVKKKVNALGGKMQLGWRIQFVPDPLPKFMLEAVHHAIWISESGEKIDITPQTDSADRIIFVSDNSTKLEKYRIGVKYYALLNCPIVYEYVRLCNLESVEYVSKTKLIEQPNIPQELLMMQQVLLLQICNKHGGK